MSRILDACIAYVDQLEDDDSLEEEDIARVIQELRDELLFYSLQLEVEGLSEELFHRNMTED